MRFGWLGAAVIGFLLGACAAAGPLDVDFESTEAPDDSAPPANGTGLRLAVAPVLSPLASFGLYRELAGYLGDRLGETVQFTQGKTYEQINDLVRLDPGTVAIVCANPYVQGREDFGMEAVAVAVPEGADGPWYYSYLIAPRSSPASSLRDFRGKTFAFSDPLSNSGSLVPRYRLALMGETPDSFFRRYIYTYAHDNSVRAVADGLVDGAAVDSLIYEYLAVAEPALVARTKVIERWGPFGNNPVVVNPAMDGQMKAQLREVLLSMDRDERGRALLRQLRIQRFVAPDESLYDGIRAMRAALREPTSR
jgi:phosphonate transport system substrate-binding protein